MSVFCLAMPGGKPRRFSRTCFTHAFAKPAAFKPVSSKMLGTMCLIIAESSPEFRHHFFTILPHGNKIWYWRYEKKTDATRSVKPLGNLKMGEC